MIVKEKSVLSDVSPPRPSSNKTMLFTRRKPNEYS